MRFRARLTFLNTNLLLQLRKLGLESSLRVSHARHGRCQISNKILQLVDNLKQIGGKHGVTAGQTTLAWILAQGNDIIPIPGTRHVAVGFRVFLLIKSGSCA